MKLIILLFFVSFSKFTIAKRFSNQYLEFDLPNSWECVLEGAEWVCQSTNAERKKEAMIVFAAKNRGPKDTIEEYQAYLKKPKNFLLPGGQTLVSEPKYANVVEVNGQKWVDALHLASEIPGFYTRYMATSKEDIGVVVTFSVSRDSYARYKGPFDKMVSSIRIFRQSAKNVKVGVGQENSNSESDNVFVQEDASDLLPAQQKQERTQKTEKKNLFDAENLLMGGAVLIALLYILKRKKQSDD